MIVIAVAASQASIQQPGSGRLPLRTYSTFDGLAGDDVEDVRQGPHGYLWISTNSGLSRFDGNQFMSFNSINEFRGAKVLQSLEDSQGVIWVATDNGIYRYRPIAGLGAPRFERVVDRGATCLHEDTQGRLWAGSGDQLLRIVRVQGKVTTDAVRIVSPFATNERQIIDAIAEDSTGSLWLATFWGVVRRLPDGRLVYYRVDATRQDLDHVHWILADRRGLIWIGHGEYLLVMRPPPIAQAVSGFSSSLLSMAHRRTLAENAPHVVTLPQRPGEVFLFSSQDGFKDRPAWGDAVESSDGAIWISTRQSLYRFAGSSFKRYGEADGLDARDLTALAEDDAGNLWIGSGTRGVIRLARRGFTSWGRREGLRGRVVSIFETGSDGLLVATTATAGGRLELYRWADGRFASVLPRVPADVVRWGWGWNQLIARDRRGRWWLPTGQGLMRYPAVQHVEDLARRLPAMIYDESNGLAGRDVFRVYEDRQGDLWIATMASPGTLTRWLHDEDRFQIVAGPQVRRGQTQLPDSPPRAFAEDPSGAMWFGLYDGGLARYAGGQWELFDSDSQAPPGFINQLIAVGDGDLWAACENGGLARIRYHGHGALDVRLYTTADGLSSNRVLCLVEDSQHQLFLGTDRGIDRFDPASGFVERFTTENGLAGSTVAQAYRGRDGALWFGTRNGVSRLLPATDPPRPVPPMLITSLRINGLDHPLSPLGDTQLADLHLAAGRNRVQVGFTAPDLVPGRRVLFQHRLVGLDAEWSKPDSLRTVDYSSLGPGAYRFEVRAGMSAAVFPGAVATMSWTIPPPIWQRWWFIATSCVALLAALYAAYRIRLAQLLALERQRTRIAMDLHDEVGSGLGSIGLLADLAAADGLEQKVVRGLSRQIGDAAAQLGTALGDIVGALRPGGATLESLALQLTQRGHQLFLASAAAFSTQFPSSWPALALPLAVRRNVFLIGVEAMYNAAQHARAKTVRLELAPQRRRWRLSVFDDGQGMDRRAREARSRGGVDETDREERNGLGLESMKRRAGEIGATLAIETRADGGTEVRLIFDPRFRLPRSSSTDCKVSDEEAPSTTVERGTGGTTEARRASDCLPGGRQG